MPALAGWSWRVPHLPPAAVQPRIPADAQRWKIHNLPPAVLLSQLPTPADVARLGSQHLLLLEQVVAVQLIMASR